MNLFWRTSPAEETIDLKSIQAGFESQVRHADVAQLVEQGFCKALVAGSSPVFGFGNALNIANLIKSHVTNYV